jgi:hypothetical protein
MTDVRDPMALVRHAAQVGDWRLVELLSRVLAGRPSERFTGAGRAYAALVPRLGLCERRGYDRA